MSYDYDMIVRQFADCRKQAASNSAQNETNNHPDLSRTEALQGAMDACEKLSGHCPMTPLLWIQYGATAFDYCQEVANKTEPLDNTSNHDLGAATTSSSLEMEIQLLQLGLQEFPGSLLLHLRHIFCVERKEGLAEQLSQPKGQDLVEALREAIVQVGRGSYGEDGELIVTRLFNSLALLYAKDGQAAKVHDLLITEQSVRPLPNESLSTFYQSICNEFSLPPSADARDPQEIMEENRRRVSKLYHGRLQIEQFEKEVQAQLSSQNLLPPWELIMQPEREQEFWELLLNPEKSSIVGMGYGDAVLADHFLKYASALSAFKGFDASDEKGKGASLLQRMTRDINDLAVSVFERAVSEAPTVEKIWVRFQQLRLDASLVNRRLTFSLLSLFQLAYLDLVHNLVRDLKSSQDGNPSETMASSPRRLLSIAQRACRNCPYSLSLVERQLQVQYYLA